MQFVKINGAALTALREAHCLTRRQLAEIAGISPEYLGQLESGIRGGNMRVADKLARALNCHVLAITVAREVVA